MRQVTHRPETHQCRREETLSTVTEMHTVLGHLLGYMAALGYADEDQLNTRLAAEEAIANAIRHGHQFDPTRLVRVSYVVTPRHLLIRVQDQGSGFDPRRVPDPLAPENVERPCGRGVFLMHASMTWVKYNARGNAVTLCKKRTI